MLKVKNLLLNLRTYSYFNVAPTLIPVISPLFIREKSILWMSFTLGFAKPPDEICIVTGRLIREWWKL